MHAGATYVSFRLWLQESLKINIVFSVFSKIWGQEILGKGMWPRPMDLSKIRRAVSSTHRLSHSW